MVRLAYTDFNFKVSVFNFSFTLSSGQASFEAQLWTFTEVGVYLNKPEHLSKNLLQKVQKEI